MGCFMCRTQSWHTSIELTSDWLFLHRRRRIDSLVDHSAARSIEAPGPPLNESENPELFSVLADVAKDTGQQLPREVYLVADVNAWVATRAGSWVLEAAE